MTSIRRLSAADPRPFTQLYLVEHRGVLTLIDTGTHGTAKKVLGALEKMGRRPEDVRQIVLTHAHGDHAGDAKALREATGASVVVGAADAEMLAGTAPYVGKDTAVRRMFIGNLSAFPRLEPDRKVDGREELEGGLVAVPTPGHTPGHISVWAPDHKAFFLGDAVWNLGPVRLSWKTFTWDWEQNRESVAAIASEPATIAFLGHGRPLKGDVPGRLKDLAARA